MVFGKMYKKIKFGHCLIGEILLVLLLSLFCYDMARGKSLLPSCQGNNFPTWTNCHGKVGPLPISGDIYDGEWKDGKYHGKGTIEYSDSTKYLGEWKDGKRHGQGTYIMSDGSMYAGQWKDSVPNGEGTYTFTDGKIDKGIWKKGKLVERKK